MNEMKIRADRMKCIFDRRGYTDNFMLYRYYDYIAVLFDFGTVQ